MGSNLYDSAGFIGMKVKLSVVLVIAIFLLLPTQSFANSGIASDVAAACSPNPTMPDVGSCSACHSTTNNRGPNDLTAAGQWALSPTTFINFCPNSAPPPSPPPSPAPPPTPAPPPGMSPAPPTPGSMGGSGASSDDDDDDDDAEDDDDGGGSSPLRSLRSRLSALRLRLSAP
ncbi:MAG: hypothetical protein L0Z73_14340 [Gammaproteobacteria bacterium]|nr:hypothetical protein [Gammaproteobacteria bacterium]